MRIILLPSSFSVTRATSTYLLLVNETIALTRFPGLFAPLTRRRTWSGTYCLRHTHLDHLATLPISSRTPTRPAPLRDDPWASESVLECPLLRASSISIWPDVVALCRPPGRRS